MNITESKEKFLKNYQSLVSQALKILNEEKQIKESPEIFEEETLALLQGLDDFYEKISIDLDDLVIEGTTKKLFISYFDKNTGYNGVKIGGKYLVVIMVNDLKRLNPASLGEAVLVKKPAKKTQKSAEQVDQVTQLFQAKQSIHPHVGTDSKVCWMNMKESINALLQEAKLLEVLLCTHSFLSRVNLDSCYIKPEFLGWKEAKSFSEDSSED